MTNFTLPLVTVSMTTFNAEDSVERAVRSVLDQTMKNFELLISDAGSTDSTIRKLLGLANEDSRVHIILSPTQTGWATLTSSGLSIARGKYFTILDGDDFVATNYLEELTVQLKDRHGFASMAHLIHCDLKGKFVSDHPSSCRSFFFTEISSRWLRLMRLILTPDTHGTCNLLYSLWPTEQLQQIGFWSSGRDERPDDDLLFVLRALSQVKVLQVPNTWICRTIPTAKGTSLITNKMTVGNFKHTRKSSIVDWNFPFFVQLYRFTLTDLRNVLLIPAIFLRLCIGTLAVPRRKTLAFREFLLDIYRRYNNF